MKSKRPLIICLSIVFWYSSVFVSAAQGEDKPEILSISPKKITRGNMITITGKNLSKKDASTIVKIDGDKCRHIELDSTEKIKVLVDTDPKPEVKKSAGEYERAVVVMVGEQQSGSCTFSQLTWGAVLKPRVLIILVLYCVAVALILFRVNALAFRSKTGQLSLSKIQMGAWTFVFSLTYVLLAAIWSKFLDISEGMFWLMGISSTTAVGAKAIVLKNIDTLDSGKPSRLLSDYDKQANSYRPSLHRCQIALWTLIVLAVYVVNCIGTMHIPEIPDKLLILMGVSGGTYLGFNYPKTK